MTNTIPQTSVELIDKYGEKVTSAIQQLADKIGVGIDHFWPVFVKQQQIEGIVGLSITGVFILLLLSLISYAIFSKRDMITANETPSIRFVILLVSISLFVIVAIGVGETGANNISKVINPEYSAIKEIMKVVK